VQRMLDGRPVVVHGDGTSIWTLTHHRDFAKGLVGLLGQQKAIAQAYQITSDEWLSWNQIFTLIGRAFGVEPKLVHIPSDVIARHNKEMGASLLGDKTHSMIFDNSKIKALVPDYQCTIPFAEGVKEIAAFHKANPGWCKVDPELDRNFEEMLKAVSR